MLAATLRGQVPRLQRPPPWGRARATLPTQRRPREKQDGAGIWETAAHSRARPRPGQPRAAAAGGFESPAPGRSEVSPCSLGAPYWASVFALLVLAHMLQPKLQWPRPLSPRASSPAWVSWSLDTGTGLSPLPSCLPNDTGEGWIVRVIGAIIAPFCHHMPGLRASPLPAFRLILTTAPYYGGSIIPILQTGKLRLTGLGRATKSQY